MTAPDPVFPRGRRRAAARELDKLRERPGRTPAHPILERAAGERSTEAMMTELLDWPMTMRRGWPEVDRLEHLLTEEEFLEIYRRNVEGRFLAAWDQGESDGPPDIGADMERARRWIDAEDAAYDRRFGRANGSAADAAPPSQA